MVVDKAKLTVGAVLLVHVGDGLAKFGLAASALVEPVQHQVGVAIDLTIVDGGRGIDGLPNGLQTVDLVLKVLCRLVGLDLDEVGLPVRFNAVGLVDVTAADGLKAFEMLERQLLEPLMI